jgi:formate dehydrogenase subunit delta
MSHSPQARMANEIAVQFHHRPAPEAAETIASHLRRFWAPAMVRQLIENADSGAVELDPLVVEAVELLR